MKLKNLLSVFALVAFMGLGAFGQNQVKIAYTSIETILAYMPEYEQVEKQLQTYRQKLAQQLQTKEEYLQIKIQEYQEGAQNNTMSPEQLEALKKEIQKLDAEINQAAMDADFKLMAKREELMGPLLTKMKTAIDDVAKAGGYTYVLNQTNSAGVSTILYGPEEHDITKTVMQKLGIQIPEEGGDAN